MVNGGDLFIYVFPGFHISAVCSDMNSFNIILRQIWMLFIRFHRESWSGYVYICKLFPPLIYYCDYNAIINAMFISNVSFVYVALTQLSVNI